MTQGLYIWSKTASNNATADSSINWAEGMAPSAVNDSARSQMARTAEYRDDISGSIVTGGTSTAYTVTSNQVFDTLAHMDGRVIAFSPHTTNGAGSPSVTLNVDGLGAKPIRSAPSVEIASGTIIQGSPYVVTYNNSDGAFYLQAFYANPYIIPIGAILDYTGTTAPNSAFVLPFGQAIDRTVYGTYFALVSTTFGSGNGTTTFNVPDLRGRVCAGLDNMGGSAQGRISTSLSTDGGTINGTTLGSAGGSQSHALVAAEVPNLSVSISLTANQFTAIGPAGGNSTFSSGGSNNVVGSGSIGGGGTTTTGGGGAHAMLQPTMMLGKILRVI